MNSQCCLMGSETREGRTTPAKVVGVAGIRASLTLSPIVTACKREALSCNPSFTSLAPKTRRNRSTLAGEKRSSSKEPEAGTDMVTPRTPHRTRPRSRELVVSSSAPADGPTLITDTCQM